MKNLILTKLALLFIVAGLIALTTTSCKTTKYNTCDAYKTHYPKLKADKHKHSLCDAYN